MSSGRPHRARGQIMRETGNGAAPAAALERSAEDTSVVGRTALVTGGASGIGLATAAALAGAGARVVIVDLPGARLDDAVMQIEGATAISADLSVREDLRRVIETAGAVDILVSNAGLQHVSALEEFPDDRWDLLLEVMLSAPFRLTRGFLPGMYESGWGRVINIASVHGLIASPYKAAYVAAKHGLVGLTKATALEAAVRCPDVTAHAICPSYVPRRSSMHKSPSRPASTESRRPKSYPTCCSPRTPSSD